MKLSKLSSREKIAVSLAGIAVAVYLVLQFVLFPMLNHRDRLKKMIQTGNQNLQEIQVLKTEYEILKKNGQMWKEQIAKRPKDFTLFSYIERLARKAQVEIAYMKPSSEKPKDSPYSIAKVELKLQDLNMKQLTPFLHMLETSENMVVIRRISITKQEKEGFIDVVLQVETFEA